MAARKGVPVKVRRVAVTNKKTGVKYIEECCYQYDPAKGYNVLLSRSDERILEGETVTPLPPQKEASRSGSDCRALC